MNEAKSLKDLLATGKKVFFILENIRSAYNVGAMFRTADGTGITGIILLGYSPTPENPKVAKTGLGAEFNVPWYKTEEFTELKDFAKLNNINEYGLELAKNSKNIYETEFESPLFIYVGNEVEGISAEVMTHLDNYVEIPMEGIKKSLNVAEASSIAMYEIFRQLAA